MTMKDVKVLVLGENRCWGMADTVDEALALAWKPTKYLVYLAHADSTVDGLAQITYPKDCPPRLILRKGIPAKK